MRKISADKIFDGYRFIKNAVVCIDEKGKILDLLPSREGLQDVEIHEGIITPGFVNTHCHLELSHMKGVVSEGKGLVQFIKELQTQREANPDVVQQAIRDADREMYDNGIVAVGDIANGSDSFNVKEQSDIHYHTFIELYGFREEGAEDALNNGKKLATLLAQRGLSYSFVPHSPYAVSQKLLKLLKEQAKPTDTIAIHNQETREENLLFQKGTGQFIDLMQWFGIDTSFWKPTGKPSLPSVKELLPDNAKLLLVHNTFTGKDDIVAINKSHENIYWAFCPNANQYIENTLPDFKLFVELNQKCTLGTDSLTSNWSLSILDEIKTIQKWDNTIPLETILQWATSNGAEALGVEHRYGSIEKNKTPGINIIDLKMNKLTKIC